MNPKARTSVLELLRPPDGYRLRSGLGTTYSAELTVVTAALLALAGAEATEDPAAMLDAVLEAGRALRILTNRGSIRVGRIPQAKQLFALYDRIVFEVEAGEVSFHPKVWVLEFEPDKGIASGKPVRYRLAVGSRNLTTAATWELAATHEGRGLGRKSGDALAASAAAFVSRCLQEVKGAVPIELRGLPSRLREVEFESPREGRKGQSLRWQWTGEPLPVLQKFSLPERATELLVVSPFLDDDFIGNLPKKGRVRLVSTQEALDGCDEALIEDLQGRGEVLVVRGRREMEGLESLDLHAKLVAWSHGRTRVTLLGSANGTRRGYSLRGAGRRNVEAMVELRPGIQIERFAKEFLRQPWVVNYRRPKVISAPGAMQKRSRLAADLGRALDFTGSWEPLAGELTIRATLRSVGEELAREANLATLAPMLAGAGTDLPVQEALGPAGASFGGLAPNELSQFVRVTLGGGNPPPPVLVKMILDVGEERDLESRKALLAVASAENLLRAALGGGRTAKPRRRPATEPPPVGPPSGEPRLGGSLPPPNGTPPPADSGDRRAEDGQGLPTLEQVLRACIDAPERVNKLRRLVEARPDVKELMPYWEAVIEAFDRLGSAK